jgi:hypothetical protein
MVVSVRPGLPPTATLFNVASGKIAQDEALGLDCRSAQRVAEIRGGVKYRRFGVGSALGSALQLDLGKVLLEVLHAASAQP